MIAVPRKSLHAALLRWYRKHGRELPWRTALNPYAVLVSEVMLQQTQVLRVLNAFKPWMSRFPTVDALARSTDRDVLIAWNGMGYNRRALNLRSAAREIVQEHKGQIPSDPAILEQLPGIGPYTARAVSCFGFDERHSIVETNIHRVLSRISRKQPHLKGRTPASSAWHLAEALLPRHSFQAWNQALMDLGATVCTSAAPSCSSCPFSRFCPSVHLEKKRFRRAKRSSATVPRRIFRGRIITSLRTAASHTLSFHRIGALLREDFSPNDHEWLFDVLTTLEHDGMILLRRRGRLIDASAVHGDFRTLSVSLIE